MINRVICVSTVIVISSDRVWERFFGRFLVYTNTPHESSAAAFPSLVVKDCDGAGRMNVSAESTGMGFYKAPTAVGGTRKLDATNQFADPWFLRRLTATTYGFTSYSDNAAS